MIRIGRMEEDALTVIRKDLVRELHIVFVLFGGVVLLTTCVRNAMIGIPQPPIQVYLLLLLAAILHLARSLIPSRILGSGMIVMFQAIGGVLLFHVGPVGVGGWLLVLAAIEAWMLLGRGEAVAATAISFAIYLFCWIAHPPHTTPSMSRHALAWLDLYLFLCFLGSMVGVTVTHLFQYLRKSHEEARAAHSLRAKLLESLQESVFVLDPTPGREGRILEANHGAEIFFGTPRSQLVGSFFQDLIASSGSPREESPNRFVLPEGILVADAIRSDGTKAWVEIAGSRHKVGDGERVLASLRSIEDRIKRHDELSRLHAELEQRVQARTQELERSHEEIRAFSYAVSHDLRAPLRAVNGFAHALLEDYQQKMGVVGTESLEVILEGTECIQQEIESVLELSRLERRGFKVDGIQLQSLVSAVCEEIADSSSRFVWASRTRIVGEWPHVESDIALQKSLWTNLVHDAMRAHPDRERPIVSISAVHVGEATTEFTIAPVTDIDATEPPIPPRKQKSRGSLQRLVDSVGGELRSRSSGDGGTTFVLRLPHSLKV